MPLSMTKFLLFVSLLGGFISQPSELPTSKSDSCFESAVPQFKSELYTTSIDIVGHHLSGLLLIKTMPDSSQRVVFTNESGISFFDFEWKAEGFKIHHVMKKIKRKIIVNTLRKDLELIIFPIQVKKTIQNSSSDQLIYNGARRKERLKVKASDQCMSIESTEVFGKKSKLVDCNFFPVGKNVPDSVAIAHHNFKMNIALKRILR
jgi:hypothetical protein